MSRSRPARFVAIVALCVVILGGMPAGASRLPTPVVAERLLEAQRRADAVARAAAWERETDRNAAAAGLLLLAAARSVPADSPGSPPESSPDAVRLGDEAWERAARRDAVEAVAAAEARYLLARDAAERARTALERAFSRYLGAVDAALDQGPAVCPIAGPLTFRDSWGEARDGGVRRHEGNDLFSPRGTPNVALTDGTITRSISPKGGRGAWLQDAAGNRYYYAHLDRWEGIYPRAVRTGEIIGYTGSTGNADSWAPHTHFEYHPGGGRAVDPFGLLRLLCGTP
jgi:murein DD-endopeptidase MepM/ murein hydrolase activator NlpD